MHELNYLKDVIILLSASVFIVAIFKRIGLSPVLGYLVAGTLIGSHGLDVVSPDGSNDTIAEFGIVFLLFVIGLELTFDRLMSMRLHVFGFGSIQTIFTAVVICFFCYKIGIDIESSVIIGGGLALSSTAIVLQVLQETGQQSNQVGRLSLAVLLMQDFIVVPLLVLVPLLAANDSSNLFPQLLHALVKATIALVLIFISGRLLLRPVLSTIASFKSNELFVATTLLLVLGISYLTDKLELSKALGAFVAGLMVAETDYRHEVERVIIPFKGLLLGLFFMTVGMNINIELLVQKIHLITSIVIALVSFKSLTIFGLCRLFKFNNGPSLHAGLLLSQGSEFAFILFAIASTQGIITEQLAQILMVSVTITMAITPLLSAIGQFVAKKIDNPSQNLDHSFTENNNKDLDKHVIIAGFKRVGRVVSSMLSAEQVNYVIVDASKTIVDQASEEGFPIYCGDITKLEMLQSLNIKRASMLIISINNMVTIQKTIKAVKNNFPSVDIIIRTQDLADDSKLRHLGATAVIPATYETGLQLGSVVLAAKGIALEEIAILKERLRANSYYLPRSDVEAKQAKEKKADSA